MKKMKITVTIGCTLLVMALIVIMTDAFWYSIISVATDEQTAISSESQFPDAIEIVESYDWYEGAEVTQNRSDRVVFVHQIGVVLNGETGDGVELDKDGNRTKYYISYSEVSDIHKGDVIETYLLANPETDGFDDFVARWDKIISKDCTGELHIDLTDDVDKKEGEPSWLK